MIEYTILAPNKVTLTFRRLLMIGGFCFQMDKVWGSKDGVFFFSYFFHLTRLQGNQVSGLEFRHCFKRSSSIPEHHQPPSINSLLCLPLPGLLGSLLNTFHMKGEVEVQTQGFKSIKSPLSKCQRKNSTVWLFLPLQSAEAAGWLPGNRPHQTCKLQQFAWTHKAEDKQGPRKIGDTKSW